MKEEPKVYTVSEVADVLRVTRQTVHNNIKSGKIKAIKVGGSTRITQEEMSEILKRGTN